MLLGASKAIQQLSSDNFDTTVEQRGWSNLHDPSSVGMYDDKTVYTDKPGSLNWKFPKEEKKEEKKSGFGSAK